MSSEPPTAQTIAPGTIDRKGTPFDPAKHLPKMHPKHGYWMPRSPGRRNAGQTRLPGVDAAAAMPAGAVVPEMPAGMPAAAPDPTASLGAEMAATMPEVTVEDTTPPTATAEASRDTPPAPAAAFVAPDLPPPPAGDSAPAEGNPDADAEVACQSLYLVTGLVTGQMAEARPAAQQHTALRRTLAAYLRSKGIRSVGGWALLIGVLGFFVEVFSKEKSGGWLKALIEKARGPRPKNVTPVSTAAPAPASPSTAPATPAGGVDSLHAAYRR